MNRYFEHGDPEVDGLVVIREEDDTFFFECTYLVTFDDDRDEETDFRCARFAGLMPTNGLGKFDELAVKDLNDGIATLVESHYKDGGIEKVIQHSLRLMGWRDSTAETVELVAGFSAKAVELKLQLPQVAA